MPKKKEYKEINPDELLKLAMQYCDECIGHTKEQMSASGKVVNVKDRHMPTIGFFLLHWLRQQHFEFYSRGHFYEVLKDNTHPLHDTTKKIEGLFEQLAIDIVANESRGIFYAKNKLGMTDQQQIQTDGKIEVVFIDQNKD